MSTPSLDVPILEASAFDVPEGMLWVAHCSDAVLPRVSREAVAAWLDLETRPWAIDWPKALAEVVRTREAAAAVLGAEVSDLSLVPSTSTALSEIAHAFPWREGDEVLLPLGEFPSNAWPWLAQAHRGVTVRQVPLWEGHRAGKDSALSTPPPGDADPEGAILAALGPRTRVLAVSWARFQDGVRLDLPRLGRACRDRGIAFLVDGIQAAGTHQPDLTFVDALAAGGQKGLLAPQGSAILYTSTAFRALIAPTGSWLSVQEGGNFQVPFTDLERPWLPDGRRLENQSCTSLQVAGLRASLELLASAGIPAIQAHVEGLQAALLAALSEDRAWAAEAKRLEALRGAGRLGPVLCFHGRTWDGLMAEGTARGIWATQREGYLRLALHGWHTAADVRRLADWLRHA